MTKGVKVTLITMSIVIILLAAGFYLFYQKSAEGAKHEPSIDEIVANAVEIPEITTNLASNNFIRIAFTIQTDSKEAKEELEKRNFQVQNIIIKQLSGMKAEDLKGTEGKTKLEGILMSAFNSLMDDDNGKVEQVFITSTIIQ